MAAVDIDTLQIEIEANSSEAASKINALVTALSNLKSVAKGGAGLTTVSKQLKSLADAAKALNSSNFNTQKLKEISNALSGLSQIQKASGLNSALNALKKIPDIIDELDSTDLEKFATQMERVAESVRPLATEMQKVANGFSAFPIRIQKIISSNSGLSASNKKVADSFGLIDIGISKLRAKFGVYYLAFHKIAQVTSAWVKESNDYVENLNLFTVAMGEYAESSKEYAEIVQEALGIDPSEWMRNQGVFMQMLTGFGTVAEDAELMSKNLTQLGYDISSFYNISIEDAMQKLQSGIAGEIEPLRRLGYAIDEASLSQVALNNGITQSVNSMNQAQKSQLRYLAIMQQSENAMNDLARTVQTPANALRILQQQITQLSRALGNLLIPFLQKVIPWVQAFVEIITEAIQSLAVLVGFELPKIDYSGVGDLGISAGQAEGALEGAAKAAKDLKNATIGIDELNIISPPEATGGAGGGASIGNDLGIDLPSYDFLDGLRKQTDDIKKQILDFFDDWGGAIAAVAGLLGGLWAINKIRKFYNYLKDIIGFIKGLTIWKNFARAVEGVKSAFSGSATQLSKFATSLALLAGDFIVNHAIWDQFAKDNLSLEEAIAGSVIAIGGFSTALYLVTGPAGAVAGVITGLIGAFFGYWDGVDEVAEANYRASDSFKRTQQSIETCTEIIDQSQQSFSNIKEIMDGIGTTESNWAGIDLLIDDIFDLSEKSNKSAYEVQELNSKVEYLNSLNIDGLKLTMDESKTSVIQTREEVENLTESLRNMARESALQNALQEVYQEYYESLLNVSRAEQELKTNQEELTRAQQEYQAAFEESTELNYFLGAFGYGTEKVQERRHEVEHLTEAQNTAQQSLDEARKTNELASESIDFLLSELVGLKTGWNDVGNSANEASAELSNAIDPSNYAFDAVGAAISATGETLKTAFSPDNLSLKESGMSSGSDLVNGISEGIVAGTPTAVASVQNMGNETYNALKAQNQSSAITPSATYAAEGLNTVIGYANGISEGSSYPVASIMKVANDVIKGANTTLDVKKGISIVFLNMGALLPKSMAQGIRENGYLATDALKELLNQMLDQLQSFANRFAEAMNETFERFERSAESFHGDDDGSVSFSRMSAPTIEKFANGGFPDHGQMFIARETGPELVGRIGNRTAVANNEQIVNSIYDAVYNATVSAMSNSSDDNYYQPSSNIVIELDGETIYSNQQSVEKRRGYPTGLNPAFD